MARQVAVSGRRLWRRGRKPLAALVVSVVAGYLLYEYSPAGWFFYALRWEWFEQRVEERLPEYDRLNDETLASLPMYPGATLLPDSQTRKGPDEAAGIVSGLGGPPYLYACYGTDDTYEQVEAFYLDALEDRGWREIRSTADAAYSKDHACVSLHNFCLARVRSEREAVYQVTVFHDLNLLLGPLDIPRIIYWLGYVSSCP
jgi:hypothetical protein